MSSLPIRSIEINGFQAFGRRTRTLPFTSLLAAIWAPNSQGKTSLAEAFEFLLTGQIVRRQLMASSQDEFADALRNAHLPTGEAVYVQAELEGVDGVVHTVKRTLLEDYGKRSVCRTSLEIDERTATQEDLTALGVVLSQPPLEAPVLAQHTLGYLFSARPQERSTYFKTLLEVTDLEEFRADVAGLEAEVAKPDDALLSKLDRVESIPECGSALLLLGFPAVSTDGIRDALSGSAAALIEANGEPAPDGFHERIDRVAALLEERRAKAFPIAGFNKKPLHDWTPPDDAQWATLDTFIVERGKVDDEARRLIALFAEALALPEVEAADNAIDCPLCASKDALTTARIELIRRRLQDTKEYQEAERALLHALEQMGNSARTLTANADEACPAYLRWGLRRRHDDGFRIGTIKKILADDPDIVTTWFTAFRRLARARVSLWRASNGAVATVALYRRNLAQLNDGAALRDQFAALHTAFVAFTNEIMQYAAVEQPLVIRLNELIDAASNTTGWQELLDLAADIDGLRSAMIEKHSRATVRTELTQALRQIDQAKKKVLDEKFRDLSNSISKWWNLLRPDERTYFEALSPRARAHRTIDFKAGLSPHADRTAPRLRDVIAVFSQSQLHCLGLALFLARAEHEGSQFVVLDDPILSSDEDYRSHFETTVVESLVDAPIQLIILTQDQRTWKNLESRYLHRDIDMFQMSLSDPLDGPEVLHTSDDLSAMLSRVKALLGGDHLDTRKLAGERLRDAAERFCKDILLRDRRARGDATAALSDYEGKNLGQLIPLVEPLLTRDASHPGKLRVIPAALNPANHDDAVPDRGTLKVTLGDLDRLKRDYL